MESMLKNVVYPTIMHSFESGGGGYLSLADVICYCKMTSVKAMDGVTNSCKRMRHSPTIGGISSMQLRKV